MIMSRIETPMQCKDVPDLPIIRFLATHGMPFSGWCNWYFGDENDVSQAMPPETPKKVKLAKMRRLIERGLVDGCPCGCRGDFVLTAKGREYLAAHPWTLMSTPQTL